MDVGSQRNRQEGRRAGCYAGAGFGFFGSVIAVGAFMSSQIDRIHRIGPTLVFAFPGIVLGGLLVGALAGRWLGGLVADLRYRPTPGGAPGPKIHKGWVAAGAVMGWIIGGAIGMGLTAVFARGVRGDWLMPILFFSPPVLCLVLGGFAGLIFARRRAAQRMGK
jgi:hypothetical protein